ncbi:MAG: hypothetical protein RMK20_08040 [Verrucomicrobiales bacterium]|nr:hypothetical protein [Verrucomicrobiales bacterium]
MGTNRILGASNLLALSVAVWWPAAATAQTGSVVTVNADRVLVINGQKVFPIGLSPGPPNRATTPWGKDALQEFREAGALLFRIVQTNDWNDALIAYQQEALDWAAEQGMFVWLNLREVSAFAAGDTAREAKLRSLVNRFKNHPALGLWKNKDEAFWSGTSAADLKRAYDVIRQEDPNHPVVQTHAPRGTVAELQPYNAATDLLALDIYPIGYPPGMHSTNANKEISMVGDFADFLNAVGGGQKSFWMIEQIAWSGVTQPGKTLRFPTFPEARFMAYQAIIHGARGLMFFGGNIAASLNSRDAPHGWNWTYWEEVLRRVVQQLGVHSPLAPALVAPESTLPIRVHGSTNIEFCVREVPPYLYILACSRGGPTTNVTFTGLPLSAGYGELLFEAPRSVMAAGGAFTDWFAPFEVHAYRFALTNPVPPSSGALVLYEPFNYSNLGGPVTSNNPTLWTYGGSGANDLSVVAGSLSYPGLAAPVGNSVTNGGAGLAVRRLLGTNFSSGEVWFSILFRINNLGYGSWNGAETPICMLVAPDNTSFRHQVVVKSNTPTTYLIGVRKSSTTSFDPTPRTAGETIFVVGKYDFTVTPNVATLWINPDPARFGLPEPPASGFVATSAGSDGFSIDRFNIRQNTVTSVPAAMQWDELRVGLSWADVTPAAAPVLTLLTDVTMLENGACQFHFTNVTAQGLRVYASTNLADWMPLGTAARVAPGRYQFTDPDATNYPRRFYQLRAP